jgi:uroporphyrinogen-III synthase
LQTGKAADTGLPDIAGMGAPSTIGIPRAVVPPLLGFTIGITAARRRDELASLLERRGARVLHAPTLQIVPVADDTQLLAATHACLAAPLDVAVVVTGIGFRGWMEAAEGWGLGDALRGQLANCRLFTRGPKATGAVRAAGLSEFWSPRSESNAELLQRLLREDLQGRRIAVQLHGEPLPDVVGGLRAAGADVVQVAVYRWAPADDIRPVQRLVEAVVTRQVDAVAFTSAPAVASLLRTAENVGRLAAFEDALRTRVLAACVGPVCASPLASRHIPHVAPGRFRLGALVRTLSDELPSRRARTVYAAGHQLRLQGNAAIVDGEPVLLPPRAAAILDVLCERPGRVFSRAELLECTGAAGDRDEHAVEMVVARLRTALGSASGMIQTVVKRGYRLAIG